MLPSNGSRRLVVLIRPAAAAASGTNPLRPHPGDSLPSHPYSSAPLARIPDADTVPYLVASCGLSPAAAAVASRRVRISSTAKADAVLAVLRRHGFSDAHISRMLLTCPRLLVLHPDKIIRPKLEFFASLGVGAVVLSKTKVLTRSLDKQLVPCLEFLRGILGTDANIRTAVSRYPSVLGFSLDNQVVPCLEFLRGILSTDASIGTVVCHYPSILGLSLDNYMRPAVEALRRHGLSEKAISKLLAMQIGVLMMKPSRIDGIFEDLEALGLPITDSRFVRGFSSMCCLKRETAWHRLTLYQSFGLSESQVAKAFMIQPTILGLNDTTIQRKLLFFRDELNIALPQLIAYPKAMAFSLEKNILPKCAVLSVLMSAGKIPKDINLLVLLGTCNKDFLERYVKKYEKDVPDVVRAYEGKIKFIGFMDQNSEVPLKSRHQLSRVKSM